MSWSLRMEKLIRLLLDSSSSRFVKSVRDNKASAPFKILEYLEEWPKVPPSLAREADAIFWHKDYLSGEIIRSASSLKFIQKNGLNYKNVDVAAADERKIPVASLSLVRNATVAEHAMTLMLACARKLMYAHRAVTQASYRDLGLQPSQTDQWNYKPNWAEIEGIDELFGGTVGVIGMGDIGMEIAKRCRAFGMEVVYNQRTAHPKETEERHEIRYLSFDDLIGAVDYLVLVIPHTPETENLIGEKQFRKMKPTATLINVARGGVVEEDALVEALRSGQIAMAGLDVYREEPLPESNPLIQLPNVVLTPHNGGGSYRHLPADRKAGLENILRFFRGETPRGIIN